MPSSINALEIYRRLGKTDWKPPSPWGPGFLFASRTKGQMFVTPVEPEDFPEISEPWIHASISRINEMPSYEDLKTMHAAVFSPGFAYQVFAPPIQHVNFHEYALHLWGRQDGKPEIPDFGEIFYKRTGVRMV